MTLLMYDTKLMETGMEKIIRNYDQFGSGLVYFIEINVIVRNVYSAQEYIV